MRIVIVSQFYPPEVGAAATRVRAWAQALLRMGHEVEVVTGVPNYPRGKFHSGYKRFRVQSEVVDGVEVHRVPLVPGSGSGPRRVLNFVSFGLTSTLGLRRCQDPDLVIANTAPMTVAPASLAFAKMRGAKAVVGVSDLWLESMRDLGVGVRYLRICGRVERALVRRADHLLALTRDIEGALVNRYPGIEVTYLPNGVDLQRFSVAARGTTSPIPIDPDKFTIIHPGTLGQMPDLDLIIDAAERLEAQGSIADFVFVGNGPERSRIESVVHDRRISNVRFHDSIDEAELAELLPFCDVGVVTAKDLPVMQDVRPAKTFPLLGSGLPVVIAAKGEFAEEIHSSGAAVRTEPGDTDGLVRALLGLQMNRNRRREMGIAAREYAEKELDWSIVMERIDHLLEAIPTQRTKAETESRSASPGLGGSL